MKKTIAVLSVCLICLLLYACVAPNAENTQDTVLQTEAAEPTVAQSTIDYLKSLIENQTDPYDCTIYIFQDDGQLKVSVYVGTVSLKPLFGEVVAGTIRSCKAVAEEEGCSFYEVSVTNGADDRMLNWHTSDLESGILINSETGSVTTKSFSELMEYCGLNSDGSLPGGDLP